MTLGGDDGIEELEKFIFQRMTEAGIVGLSIATIKEGELQYQKGFGFRDFDRGLSATPETIYCIGSVTKSFTALAIMQLCEKGLLSLDDPIDRYVPFKAKPMGEPILIKHLLSHTSGISSLGYAEATLTAITEPSDLWLPISNAKDLLVFMKGAEEWAISKPGQRHAYWNEGYILLGAIIGEVSGASYAEYVKENILKPLRMDRSTFLEDEVDNDGDVAVPYITGRGGGKVATRYPYGQLISDGGLMSNTPDMVRFLKMFLSDGVSEDAIIVSPASIRNMMEPRIRTVEEPIEGAGYSCYGYGLRIKTGFLGQNLIHHSGSVFGSSAYMCFIPDKKAGVVILANGGYWLEPMGEYAMALLLGRDPMEITSFRRGEILDGLTGTYKTFRDTSTYRVTRSGGILQLESRFGERTFTTPLIPVDLEGETKQFRVYGIDATTLVQFVQRNGGLFLIYERNMAKRVRDV
jgi:CubicO group peptidase (beta-lactamase class C family)